MENLFWDTSVLACFRTRVCVCARVRVCACACVCVCVYVCALCIYLPAGGPGYPIFLKPP